MQVARSEIVGGLTTFFTMAYIIFVNPAILSSNGTGMPFSGVLTATVLLCFSMTALMGLYAKLPFAVGPGMGINAFFAYSVILSKGVPWPTALGIVFWAGVFFLFISILPIRVAITRAIPQALRIGTAGGIGIFLTFIGLKETGLVVSDPVTLVKVGKVTTEVLLSLVGFAVILFLYFRKSPFAFLGGIAVVTLIAFCLGKTSLPDPLFSKPDFQSVLIKLDIWGALKLSYAPIILTFLFTDFFDSISTFIGVSHATNMLDEEGNPKNLKQGLIVDSIATLTAGLFGTSSGTAYIESASGIEAGGRTGLASVVTAVCFLPCLFIAPLAGMVPSYATAPVLMIVGFLLFKTITHVSFDKLEEALPTFVTLILIPLTFSITQGILWGFISYVGAFLLAGRRKDLSPILILLAVVSVGMLVLS